jgi:hypothetical protein
MPPVVIRAALSPSPMGVGTPFYVRLLSKPAGWPGALAADVHGLDRQRAQPDPCPWPGAEVIGLQLQAAVPLINGRASLSSSPMGVGPWSPRPHTDGSSNRVQSSRAAGFSV